MFSTLNLDKGTQCNLGLQQSNEDFKYNSFVFIISLAAGHFADSLIQNRWSVLSVRRLMTAIGLLGPGLFMLLFISVDNLLLAVV